MKLTATLTLALSLATVATSQEITPEGFGPTPVAPAPAPASTPAPTAPAIKPTETPATTTTPTTSDAVNQKLDLILGQTARSAQGSELDRLSKDLTKVGQSNAEATWQGIDQLNKDQLRLEKQLTRIYWLVFISLVLLLTLVGNLFFAAWKTRKSNKPEPDDDPQGGTPIAPAIAILLALSATCGFHAQANTPCTIRAITTGSVVVKGQDPSPIAITTRNCGDIKSLTVAGTGTKVTEFAQKGDTITAKVTADDGAKAGPKLFKLGLADGSEVVSPGSLYILVTSPEVAVAMKEAAQANFQTKTVAEAANTRVTRLTREVKDLETRVETMATKAEIADLKAQVKATATLALDARDQCATNSARTIANGQATVGLTDLVERLGNTPVKKGFWGKKPLSPEVAKAAQEVRETLLNTK